jgi:amino acid adenylation domain-containing protein
VLLCDNRNQGAVAELLDGSNAVHTVVNADRGEILLERATASRVTEETNEDPDTRDLAYILFTSGSTGEPKGVPITNANVFAYLQTAVELSEIGPNDRTIQLVEVTFDLSVHDMFLTWLHGACLYSVPENASLMATRFVEEHGITGWMSVPSTAGISKQSGALGSADLSSLRFTFFCGEPLTRGVAEAWSSAAPHSRIYNVYGPTEATVAFSWFRFDRPATDIPHIVPLGQANHGQELGLFTPEGCRAAEGEICMSGSQVMRGYWKAPEITASRFFQAEGRRWYRTGDIGRHDPALGYLFAGRIDQQVKIRGFRVELQEIETIVRRVSGRDIVAVVPWPVATDVGATGCVAFVAGKPMDADELRLACASILPDYMVPQRFVFEESLPLNSNGKIDYGALKRHHTLGAAV